jgi:hypothetical protein
MGNEEANEIALLALRQVGCRLPDDCSGVESFTTDILVIFSADAVCDGASGRGLCLAATCEAPHSDSQRCMNCD